MCAWMLLLPQSYWYPNLLGAADSISGQRSEVPLQCCNHFWHRLEEGARKWGQCGWGDVELQELVSRSVQLIILLAKFVLSGFDFYLHFTRQTKDVVQSDGPRMRDMLIPSLTSLAWNGFVQFFSRRKPLNWNNNASNISDTLPCLRRIMLLILVTHFPVYNVCVWHT